MAEDTIDIETATQEILVSLIDRVEALEACVLKLTDLAARQGGLATRPPFQRIQRPDLTFTAVWDIPTGDPCVGCGGPTLPGYSAPEYRYCDNPGCDIKEYNP